MSGFDLVDSSGCAVHQFAIPAATRQGVEYLLNIAASQNLGFKDPWVIMRIGARFLTPEVMKRLTVVEVIFDECTR
ncbi:hypothetical protein KZX46_00530 (plasmid) [Polymorphobacter sp. PAMC 29334]|uniref:hypothetical protein n=1 Tax=Polymorphobacter sp. PAMC 29334 TaxID=2862331 RepID=UPI001C77C377|nr:hypothetical protein [Polymorphobacter sp. PAMC 29334]QYE33327.1 hypothetical protein KZX46_00530 [Polymorphobacter sp. PAMC 29334]